MVRNRSHILIRNTLYNFASQLWFLILGFITVPYILRKLGTDAYGVLSSVSVIVGYFAYLELGIGNAVIKYVSEYYAKEDYDMVKKIIGTAISTYLLAGLVGGILTFLLTGILVSKLLKIPPDLINLTYTVFYLSALGFFFNMLLSVFSSIPRALQRFDISNKITIIMGSIQSLGTVLLLYLGFFLKEIITLNVLVSFISLLIYYWIISKKLLPQIPLKPLFNKELFLKLLRFGSFVFASGLASMLLLKLDKLLIGFFLNISYLTYYVVSFNLAQKLWGVSTMMTSAMFPVVSELSSLKHDESIKQLYVRGMKYIGIGITPITIVLTVLAEEFFSFWISPEFATEATLPFRLLLIAIFINCFAYLPAMLVEAVGRPEIHTKIAVVAGIANTVFCLLFIPRWGISGAALAFLISMAIHFILFIFIVSQKIVKVSSITLLKESFGKPMLLGIMFLPLLSFLKESANNLIGFVFLAGSVFVLYYIAAYLLIMDKYEKKLVSKYILLWI